MMAEEARKRSEIGFQKRVNEEIVIIENRISSMSHYGYKSLCYNLPPVFDSQASVATIMEHFRKTDSNVTMMQKINMRNTVISQ